MSDLQEMSYLDPLGQGNSFVSPGDCTPSTCPLIIPSYLMVLFKHAIPALKGVGVCNST